MSDDSGAIIPTATAWRLRLLLLFAMALLAVGISTPMVTISKLLVVRNSFSVLSGVTELLRNGQFVLFVLIAGFSIVLPVLKLAVLFRITRPGVTCSGSIKRYLHLMHEYGRWAMLDVMVVAVLIMTVKLGAIASVQVHWGLYVFGASVLLIMFITHRVVRLTRDPG